MKIAMNEFARRQVEDSPFSHYEASFDDLVELVTTHFDNQEKGYRDGVVLVNLPPGGFKAGVIRVYPSTDIRTEVKPRREGEAPYIHVTAVGSKADAASVQIVLYHKDVLAEGKENSTDAEWEIISVNASASPDPEPMDPMTMARNFLEMVGGTKGEFSAEDFAKSIVYWSDKARVHTDTK